ncbi:hypothetical protein WME90_26145 [Sorangium sp. So ce375]|uniref:hypothetical protein n=1 Tax=Sorangium sp. So ce375 TaxID=3133306 RepID=UPI003F5CA310
MASKELIDAIKAQGEAVANIHEERAAKKAANDAAVAAAAQKAEEAEKARADRLKAIIALVLPVISDIAHHFQAANLAPKKEPIDTTTKDGHTTVTAFYRLTYAHADKRVSAPLRVGVTFGWFDVGSEVDAERRVLWIGGTLLVKSDEQDEWKELAQRNRLPKDISERIGFSKVSADTIEEAVKRTVAHYRSSE